MPSDVGLFSTLAAGALSAIIGAVVIHFLFREASPHGKKLAWFTIALLAIVLGSQYLARVGTWLLERDSGGTSSERVESTSPASQADSTLLHPAALLQAAETTPEVACQSCRFFAVQNSAPSPCFSDYPPNQGVRICVDFVEILKDRLRLGLAMDAPEYLTFGESSPTIEWQLATSDHSALSALTWRGRVDPAVTQFKQAKPYQRRELYFPRPPTIDNLAGQQLTLWFPTASGIRGRSIFFQPAN
jgi:hypothetical protein